MYMKKGFLIYKEMRKYFTIYEEAVSHRGRPSANAANSCLEFTAGMSQKCGRWNNIWAL